MTRVSKAVRRTVNVRTRGRAARVLERVLSATAAELGRVGYTAMRVEDVAADSGVNKTTIYRRWPTKAKLVATAMIEQSKQYAPVDTGTLRGDLRSSLLAAFNLKASERGILRFIQTEHAVPGVNALAQRFRDEVRRLRIAMVERGIARGELPKGADAGLVVDLVSAPVQRALLFNERMNARYIERVLDVVLAGAAARASDRSRKSARTRRPRPKQAAKR